MFSDLLQVQENAKSKDILKIFKEFIFFNEYENNSPNVNINFNLNNNINNLNNSNEKINQNIQEESPKSDYLNKSKEIKDNFNTKTNIINNPINILNNLNTQNLSINNNSNISKKLNLNFPKNLNSSNSLKFVSRKSKLLRALDLYDILFNFQKNSFKREDEILIENKLEGEEEQVEGNLVENADSYKIKNIGLLNNNGEFKSSKNVNFSFQDFEGRESNKENIKNFEKKSNLTSKIKNYKNDVIEYRFMRHNLMFSVRIQKIENFFVLIFENLDEEKKQIQNNLIKSIKNQYIITISHELNNPLNGLIHCIEELDLEEEEKKKQVVNKIKRFKFLIKFFLKNIITNFKFFLNEPIEKRASNISFGFILESIKRSLFEFYEYKNITVIHDFANLNNFVLNYDYFYFRYLLKNIFMYFYYKIPRNGKLIIEFEKESDIIDLNNFIRGNDTSEIGSSNESGKSSNEERDTKNLNLRLKSHSSNNNNTKTLKKKITMVFKTEMQTGKTRKSSRNIFDKAFLENFDIENSIQTLEMLIESINKISKLLGIKIDFSNFNKKNTRIQMNLNYYLDEDDSCVYNDINEYNEEYEKYKANCVFSINRTLINEEKKIFLNPTLNMDYKSNLNKSSHLKYLGSNMNSSNLNFHPFNYTVRTYSSFDNCTPINFVAKDKANYMISNNLSKFNGLKVNNLNKNESNNLLRLENSFLDSNKNCNEFLSVANSGPMTTNSNFLSSCNKEIQEPGYSPILSIRSVDPKIRQDEFNSNKDMSRRKSGYSIFKENVKKKKNNFNKDKQEVSLFSKQRKSKNSDDNKIYQSTINQNIKHIFINQNEIEKVKEKFSTELLSSKKIFFLEEAMNNSSDSMSNNDNFEENLKEVIFDNKEKRSSECSKKDYDINSKNEKVFSSKDRASSEVINSVPSSESNSICYQSFVKKIYVKSKENSLNDDYNNNSNRKIRNNDLKIVNEKNKKYFFNTYNTYLNINNVENLDVLNPSINNKNLLKNKNTKIYETIVPIAKDDFLTKYCRVKDKKYRSSSPDSNENITNQYKQNKKFKIQEVTKFINQQEKNEKSSQNELLSIKEIGKNVNIEAYKKNSDIGKVKKKELKDLMKNIEKNFNPKNFNFSNEIISSQEDSKEEIINNNLNKTENVQSIEYENEIENSAKGCKNSSDTLNKNLTNINNENNSENNDEINEYYDNYDQNLNNNLNKNYAQFAKNPFGKNDQTMNINYIRSPRLFFSSKIPSQIKNKRRNSKKSNNSSDNPDKPKCECNDILIVDDELFNISSMKFLLKKKKLKADSAINGRESIDKINEKLRKQCSECNQSEYKLIFMDIMMPELDGIEASKLIQEIVEKKTLSENVKILILTAHDTEIIRKRAAGIKIIKEFISKPVKKSIVDELLNKHYFSFHN